MKLAHILFQPELSGAPRAALDIMKRLDRKQFDVHLIASEEGDVAHEARRAGIEVHLLGAQVMGRIDPFADVRALSALCSELRASRYDLVHTHSSKAGFLGRLAAAATRVPLIVHTVQGFAFHEQSGWLSTRIYTALERLAGRYSSAVLFVNDEDLAVAVASKIAARARRARVPNGVDFSRLQAGAAHREQYRSQLGATRPGGATIVTMVGRLAAQKAPMALVRAAAQVARDRPHVQFLLVGDGPLRSQLEQQIIAARLESTVHLLGWRTDVVELLHASDVFCLPSLWEGLPVALQEAMAIGLPAVATDIKGSRELIDDGVTGLLVAPHDDDALARALLRMLDQPQLAQRLGQAGQARVHARYAIDVVTDQVSRIYLELGRELGL